jgi:tetratricopeptide (TPR) repeat protein
MNILRRPRQQLIAAALIVLIAVILIGATGFRSKISIFLLAVADRLDEENPQLAAILLRGSKAFADNAQSHFLLGRYLKTKRSLDDSLAQFMHAFRKDHRFPRVNYEIGQFYFIKKLDADEAIDFFSREIELSGDPHTYHLRGIVYGTKNPKEWQKAEQDFRTEMALWDSWGASLNLAWILFAQGRLDEAEEAMRITEAKHPGSVWTHNGLGVIYLNRGEFGKAQKELAAAFQKATVLTPEEYWTAYPGNVTDDVIQAIQDIQAGIALNLALAYEKSGEYQAAIVWYEKTKELIRNRNHIVAGGVDEEAIQAKISALLSQMQ